MDEKPYKSPVDAASTTSPKPAGYAAVEGTVGLSVAVVMGAFIGVFLLLGAAASMIR
jgi:hypothetical protein